MKILLFILFGTFFSYELFSSVIAAPADFKDGETQALSLPPTQWKNKKFIFLSKPKLFQGYGYELYRSAPWKQSSKLSKKKSTPIPYGPFVHKLITVCSVEALANGEYGITALANSPSCSLYCVTTHGSIQGIAFFDDLSAAQKRWKVNSIIYSRLRAIQAYDSVTSQFKSIKVSLTEPLTVCAVSWGMTPLPPQNLWIKVKCKNATHGFIPTRISWTNVSTLISRTKTPWEAEIIDTDLSRQYQWDKQTWEAIDNHAIIMGMSTYQVRLSWGEPVSVNREEKSTSNHSVTLIYPTAHLLFINDSLTQPAGSRIP